MQNSRTLLALTRLFDTPPERVIAVSRIFLAASALAAFFVDNQGTPDEDLTRLVLIGYVAFALGVIAWDYVRALDEKAQHLIHAVDIAATSALLFLTHGPASPYFVLCVFVLVAGALRWNWQGPFFSTLLLAGVLFLSYLTADQVDPEEVNRLVVRAAFLVVGGFMLTYAAAYRQRSRHRLARLAAWPAAKRERGPVSLEPALAHAAGVLQAPSVLVLWEQFEEPSLHLLHWESETAHYSREQRKLFGDFVARSHSKASFVFEAGASPAGSKESIINPDLQKTFRIETAATAPFARERCAGRVFLINRSSWSAEDLALTEIVAARLGIEIEELLLREEVAGAAGARERERLGRDLHDGVLQGLAAATMQLRAIAESVSGDSRQDLAAIRTIISEEAQKIRRFIEETRNQPTVSTGVVELAPEVMEIVENAQRRWGCQVDVTITPPDLKGSLSVARSIRHMLNEAISNAVRHGRASRVEADIAAREDRIMLSIQDDGIGFVDLDGSYTQKQLKSENLGPLSLRSRVEELGGVLYLTSTPTGANITIEFPK
jgi:signal transduction histidine kinase